MAIRSSLSGKAKRKVCFIVVNDFVFKVFLLPLLRRLTTSYSIFLVGELTEATINEAGVDCDITFLSCPISRKINIFQDICTLFSLISIFRQHRFDCVISMVPKAGLLGMSGGFIAQVPVRVHYFVGQVWATQKGPFAAVLKYLDRLTATLSTARLVDSPSQLKYLADHGFFKRGGASVLGYGSVCGVNLDKFKSEPVIRRTMRENYGFSRENIVTVFMARITKDKGAFLLAEAFEDIFDQFPDARLVLVGPEEEVGLISEIKLKLKRHLDRVFFEGFTDNPNWFMNMADIYCMPSFREGLGMSTLCASAAERPTVGSRIYGTVNAIDDGVTGLLFEPNDRPSLVEALAKLHRDENLRVSMGKNGRSMVESRFEEFFVVDNFSNFILSQISIVK